MKTRQYFFYFALTASTCIQTSCSDENLSLPAHDGQPVEIRADMAVAGTSPRTVDISANNILDKTSFTTGDVISITKGSKTCNYEYTTNNAWKPVTPGQYFTTAVNESYTATYERPDCSSTIPEDQRTLANFRNLYYYKLSSPSVTLTGSNVLNFTGGNALKPTSARITIHVSYPEERIPVSVTLTGNGIRTGSTATPETIQCLYMNEPTFDFDNSATPPAKAKEQSWTAIIKEGTSLTYTITIVCKVTDSNQNDTEAEKTGTYTQSAKTLAGGTNYVYRFSFSDYPRLTNVTVEDFADSGSGETDAGSAH